jgi:CRP/FNR family cyclic AMP-dependent transcriptional regulator
MIGRSKEKEGFNPELFLNSPRVAKQVTKLAKAQTVYSQGERYSSVLYIISGTVKLSAINEEGKEAVIAILEAGDFLGEACLTDTSSELVATAMAIEPTTVLVIQKKEMLRILYQEQNFRNYFISYLLRRNAKIEADLVDQLHNSIEKRLARALLLLARPGKESSAKTNIPKIPQETLAELIGTTRSRVNLFMNKFRRLGFIDYSKDKQLRVHESIIDGVLHA